MLPTYLGGFPKWKHRLPVFEVNGLLNVAAALALHFRWMTVISTHETLKVAEDVARSNRFLAQDKPTDEVEFIAMICFLSFLSWPPKLRPDGKMP